MIEILELSSSNKAGASCCTPVFLQGDLGVSDSVLSILFFCITKLGQIGVVLPLPGTIAQVFRQNSISVAISDVRRFLLLRFRVSLTPFQPRVVSELEPIPASCLDRVRDAKLGSNSGVWPWCFVITVLTETVYSIFIRLDIISFHSCFCIYRLLGISYSNWILLVPDALKRDSTSAPSFFIPVRRNTSKFSSKRYSHHRESFTAPCAWLRTHLSASWSVHIVNGELCRYILSSQAVQRTWGYALPVVIFLFCFCQLLWQIP